jgi:hypothetical protein
MVLFNLLLAILWPLSPVVEIVATLRMLLSQAAKGFAGPRPRMKLAGPAGVQFARDRGSSPLAAATAARRFHTRRFRARRFRILGDDDSVWTTIRRRRRRRFSAIISRRFFWRARISAPPWRGHKIGKHRRNHAANAIRQIAN